MELTEVMIVVLKLAVNM